MVRRPYLPLLILLAFWAAVYLPHLVAGDTLPARDVAATQLPWRAAWRDQVLAGHYPIWDDLSNQGRPLAANPNAMALYPGTLLFLLAPLEVAATLHLAVHHLILLLGLYRLARRSGASSAAAGVAAAAIGSGGVAFSLLTFLNAQASFAWAPWALATAAEPPPDGLPRVRRALAAGVFLALSALGGEPVVALVTALAWLVVVLWQWRPAPWWSCLLTMLAAALLAAPLLVPLLAVLPETARGTLGAAPGALGADALAPRRLPELLLPNLLGPPLADGRHGFWAQASFGWQRYYPLVFPGSTVLLALAWARRRGRLAPWWWLTFAGLVVSVGLGLGPLAAAAQRVPGVGALRYGIKALLLAVLAAVPLVAAGWQRLHGRWAASGRRWSTALLVACVLLAPLAAFPRSLLRPLLRAAYPASVGALGTVADADLRSSLAIDAAALAAPPAALLVAGPSAVVAMAATLAANAIAARGVLLFDDGALWSAPPPVAAALKPHDVVFAGAPRGAPEEGPQQPGLGRFWEYRAALVPSFATRWGHGYVLASGPDGLEPVRQELIAAAASKLAPAARLRVAAALGADVAVLPPEDTAGTPCQPIDGVCIERLRGAPRAYLAERLIRAVGPVATVNALAEPSFRPGRDAVVEGPGGAVELAGGELTPVAVRPGHLRLRTRSAGRGLLVISQSYLAAWRARIDGVPAEVMPVNGSCLGVSLPGGRHDVVVFVDPRPCRAALAGPVLLLALVVVLTRRGRRRPRRAAGRGVRPSPDRPAASDDGVHSSQATRPESSP